MFIFDDDMFSVGVVGHLECFEDGVAADGFEPEARAPQRSSSSSSTSSSSSPTYDEDRPSGMGSASS